MQVTLVCVIKRWTCCELACDVGAASRKKAVEETRGVVRAYRAHCQYRVVTRKFYKVCEILITDQYIRRDYTPLSKTLCQLVVLVYMYYPV